MKRYHLDALAKCGVKLGPQEHLMDPEYDDLPKVAYRLIEGPRSKAYITHEPRGWGGDGKYKLRPAPDSPHIYSIHTRQQDAVAEFLRKHY